MMTHLSLSLSLSSCCFVGGNQILVRAKKIQPERDETEEDWREEEENARAEKRDAETRVIETLSSCSSIEIPDFYIIIGWHRVIRITVSLSFDVSFRRSFF